MMLRACLGAMPEWRPIGASGQLARWLLKHGASTTCPAWQHLSQHTRIPFCLLWLKEGHAWLPVSDWPQGGLMDQEPLAKSEAAVAARTASLPAEACGRGTKDPASRTEDTPAMQTLP
ncbi:Polycystin-1 [Manis pentadactyla]|nr:Polycystin-1 [Manis pentadactyla]